MSAQLARREQCGAARSCRPWSAAAPVPPGLIRHDATPQPPTVIVRRTPAQPRLARRAEPAAVETTQTPIWATKIDAMPGPTAVSTPKVVAVTCQSYGRNAAPAHRRSTCGGDAEAIPIVRAGGPRLSSTRFFTPVQQGLRLARQPLRQGRRKERHPLHSTIARNRQAVRNDIRLEMLSSCELSAEMVVRGPP